MQRSSTTSEVEAGSANQTSQTEPAENLSASETDLHGSEGEGLDSTEIAQAEIVRDLIVPDEVMEVDEAGDRSPTKTERPLTPEQIEQALNPTEDQSSESDQNFV